jgi:thioredoxin-related protein
MHNANSPRGLLIVATLALLSFNTGAHKSGGLGSGHPLAEGIQFIEEDWKEALKEAGKQNKLIFLDAYTSWCGPCKLLKRNTFPDKNAGEFFNKNFINVAVNMEKGYGPLLAQQYFVTAYPTLIVTDANGDLLAYTRGYIKPKQLIEFGRYALSRKNKIK